MWLTNKKGHLVLLLNRHIWDESGSCFINKNCKNNLNSSTKHPKITPKNIGTQSEFEETACDGCNQQTIVLGT